jgi:hypothetical protein
MSQSYHSVSYWALPFDHIANELSEVFNFFLQEKVSENQIDDYVI